MKKTFLTMFALISSVTFSTVSQAAGPLSLTASKNTVQRCEAYTLNIGGFVGFPYSHVEVRTIYGNLIHDGLMGSQPRPQLETVATKYSYRVRAYGNAYAW